MLYTHLYRADTNKCCLLRNSFKLRMNASFSSSKFSPFPKLEPTSETQNQHLFNDRFDFLFFFRILVLVDVERALLGQMNCSVT